MKSSYFPTTPLPDFVGGFINATQPTHGNPAIRQTLFDLNSSATVVQQKRHVHSLGMSTLATQSPWAKTPTVCTRYVHPANALSMRIRETYFEISGTPWLNNFLCNIQITSTRPSSSYLLRINTASRRWPPLTSSRAWKAGALTKTTKVRGTGARQGSINGKDCVAVAGRGVDGRGKT